LRARVVTGALAARSAGRPARPVPVVTSLEAFRRTVDSLDAVLAGLAPEEWARPALRDLDVQGLVGHLIGVEREFQARVGSNPASAVEAHHVGSTQAAADAEAGRPPASTHRDWLAMTVRTIDRVEAAASPEAPVTMHGVTLPLDQWLVVRSFEMWTHEEDVRRAVGRPLLAPETARLALMTQLAVSLLPTGMARAGRATAGRATAGRATAGRSARLVLTGDGGGTWQIPPADGSTADVRIVVDCVTFCRLVANRHAPTDAAAVITGDQALADDVFAGAAALAFD
jgi:uncharacterized protein (TIGR03083 family)